MPLPYSDFSQHIKSQCRPAFSLFLCQASNRTYGAAVTESPIQVAGKQKVTVRIEATSGNEISAVFGIRADAPR